MVDKQRSRVYGAEAYFGGTVKISHDATAKLVTQAWEWAKAYYDFDKAEPVINYRPELKRRSYYRYRDHSLNLATWAYCEAYVLHEVAHAVVRCLEEKAGLVDPVKGTLIGAWQTNDVSSHGPAFTRVSVELYSQFMKPALSRTLMWLIMLGEGCSVDPAIQLDIIKDLQGDTQIPCIIGQIVRGSHPRLRAL